MQPLYMRIVDNHITDTWWIQIMSLLDLFENSPKYAATNLNTLSRDNRDN